MVVWYHTIPTIPLFAKIIVALMGGLVAVRAYAQNIFEDDVIQVTNDLTRLPWREPAVRGCAGIACGSPMVHTTYTTTKGLPIHPLTTTIVFSTHELKISSL